MRTRESVVQQLEDQGAVAVVRLANADAVDWVADTLVDAGLHALEITLTVPGAIGQIAQLTDRLGQGHLVGAGSVLTAEDATRAIDAGASYVVSPATVDEVVECCNSRGVPVMPGCFTPTEALRAHRLGADVIKVFPADVVGMPFFRSVLAPMPHLRLMPTGGVTPENAGDWIRAGAVAVGVGSALLGKRIVAERDTRALRERTSTLLGSVRAARDGAA
jgi:2-dehydro-3-deoxyphosphogluconate aldolase/(4S)-4-hydroxy-2-oxoglutarate aldolase